MATASSSRQDAAVQSTNDDAATCKCSAVRLGYWKDPYVQFFAKPCDRKPPEINRGYYARVKGIDSLLKQFLQLTKQNCQVVNLGAGSDTHFWNLADEGLLPKKWIEVDFDGIVNRKIYTIRSRKPLLEKIATAESEARFTKTEVHGAIYHLVAADLRDTKQLERKLDECDIDRSLPTAFIAECVLVYMPAKASSDLVRWIADAFPTAFFINYEQVNMGDKFGEVMIDNLHNRGCSLDGVEHCRTLETQYARFLDNGWHGAHGTDVMTVYMNLPQLDIQRIEKLEFLDDRDMLTQLCSHYCVVWAFKETDVLGLVDISLIAR